MATNYPGALDSWSNPGATTKLDDTGYEHDVVHSNVYDALEAIEGELGVDPSAVYASVAARLLTMNPCYRDMRQAYVGPDFFSIQSMPFSQINVVSQILYMIRWVCPASFTATKLWWVQNSGTSGVTAATIGIYNSSGTLLQSADIATPSGSTGLKSVTITSQALTAGTVYYLAILVNATTPGAIAGNSFTQNSLTVTGSSSSDRAAYAPTGQTSMPSSVTLSSAAVGSAAPLIGVSAA